MIQINPILCQGDAFLLELEAEKASESSKASRQKKKKKKGVPDLQPVRTYLGPEDPSFGAFFNFYQC